MRGFYEYEKIWESFQPHQISQQVHRVHDSTFIFLLQDCEG